MTAPLLWILAGPNGSGKSTIVQSDIFDALARTPESDQEITRLNPDEHARAMRAAEPHLTEAEIALRAAQACDGALDQSIAAGRSVLVETVLSSDKLKARVEESRRRGFAFWLTYVLLRHPDYNVARVAQRVRMGGHDVPPARVRARWARSLANLPWFAARADSLSIWDNTRPADEGAPPELILAATPEGVFRNAQASLFADAGAHPATLAALEEVLKALGFH